MALVSFQHVLTLIVMPDGVYKSGDSGCWSQETVKSVLFPERKTQFLTSVTLNKSNII